jgi:hypothetical protein
MLGGTLPSETERELAAEYQREREAPLRALQISTPVHEGVYSISESDLFAGNPQTARHGPQLALLAEVVKQRTLSSNSAVAARMLSTPNEGKERTGREDKFRDGMGARDLYRDIEPQPIISAARPPRGIEDGLAPTKQPLGMLAVQVVTPDLPRQEIDPTRPEHDSYFRRGMRAMADGAVLPPSFLDHPSAARPSAPEQGPALASAPVGSRPSLDAHDELAPVSVMQTWGFAPSAATGGVPTSGPGNGLAGGDPLSLQNSELFSNAFCRAQTGWDKLVLIAARAWRIIQYGTCHADSDCGVIAYATLASMGAMLLLFVFSTVHSFTIREDRSRRRV